MAKQITVLIVEDDDDIRDSLQVCFEGSGLRILTATNGLEGLITLGRIEPPAVILTDLNMPVMDGWNFIAQVRKEERWKGVPIIIMSAAAPGGMRKDQKFIRKPFDIDAVLQTVKQACGPACSNLAA